MKKIIITIFILNIAFTANTLNTSRVKLTHAINTFHLKKDHRQMAHSSNGTHMESLITAVVNTHGPILEMGCGDFSTPLLHALCTRSKRFILSVETHKNWMLNFTDLQTEWHNFVYLKIYDNDDTRVNPKPSLWDTIGLDRNWSIVLIDHAPEPRRIIDIQRLRNNTEIFVIHDTEATSYGYEPIINSFKYKYVNNRYLPSTTVVSDTIDVSKFFN